MENATEIDVKKLKFHHLKAKLKAIFGRYWELIILVGILVIVLLILVTATVVRNVQSSNAAKISPTPAPTEKPTPTPDEEKEATSTGTLSPTKKLTPTKIPTRSPTPTTRPANTATPQPATNTPAPTNTPVPTSVPPTATPIPDTQPPTTHVLYPTNNGEITYKTDGKVCATLTAPTDNVSPFAQIQTQFAFDGDGWSSYQTTLSSACKDTLPNGAHTLKVRSKDAAGNVEAEQTISFTVNIPGN